jgi:hypothetical protein
MGSDPHQPLRTRRYKLTRADALAYERLPGEISGRGKFALLLWLALPALIAGILSDEVSATVWWTVSATAMVLALGSAVIVSRMIGQRRAAMHPVPVGEVRLEQWTGHLAEFADGRARLASMTTIGKVITTPEHVFVCAGRFPMIVPRAAFDDERDMLEFADWLDEESSKAQP